MAVYVFLLAAPLVVVYYSFSPGVVLRLPPEGFTLRWYDNFFAQPRLVEGVRTSVVVASLATALALLAGLPAAYALTRVEFRGRAALAAFFLSPLNLPGLVLAIGLLMFFVTVVQPLIAAQIVGGLPALLGAHVVVTVPWVIRTVSASLETADRAPEEAARGLGATALETFWLVTLPTIRPGVVAGAIFAFIVSFGNFALSLFFTGPGIITLPVAIFQYVDQFQDPTVAAGSSVVILMTTIVVVLADRLGSISRGLGTRGTTAQKGPPRMTRLTRRSTRLLSSLVVLGLLLTACAPAAPAAPTAAPSEADRAGQARRRGSLAGRFASRSGRRGRVPRRQAGSFPIAGRQSGRQPVAGAAAPASAPAAAITPNQFAGKTLNVALAPGRIDDLNRLVVPEFERLTGAKVQLTGARSSDQLARARIEKDRPTLDILWLDVGEAELLGREGLVAKLTEAEIPNLRSIRDNARSKLGIAPIAFSSALGFLYNKDLIQEPPGRGPSSGIRASAWWGWGAAGAESSVSSSASRCCLPAPARLWAWWSPGPVNSSLPALMPPSPLPIALQGSLNGRILAFGVCLAAAMVPFFGLLPASTPSEARSCLR